MSKAWSSLNLEVKIKQRMLKIFKDHFFSLGNDYFKERNFTLSHS